MIRFSGAKPPMISQKVAERSAQVQRTGGVLAREASRPKGAINDIHRGVCVVYPYKR